jgi:hypothetical protein
MKYARYVVMALLAVTATAQADEGGRRFGLLFAADLEFGGDDLATVTFPDGDTQDVTTGDGVTLALGGYVRPIAASPFSVRATAGYKFAGPTDNDRDCNFGCDCDCDSESDFDPDVEIERWVFETVANYTWQSGFWVGAGVTHHAGIEFQGNGFAPNLGFDDATGPTAELGWKWIALSYTDLEYTDDLGSKWNSESYGLAFSVKLDRLIGLEPR